MAELYRARLAGTTPEGAPAQRQEQQTWLRQRAKCEAQPEGSPALSSCVQSAIASRIAALQPAAAAAAAPAHAPGGGSGPAAAGAWTLDTSADACNLSWVAAGGRRFVISHPASAAPDHPGTPSFLPGPNDRELVLPGDRVVLIVDLERVDAVVPAQGEPRVAVPPGSEAAAMRTILAGRGLSVVRQIDTLLEVPLDGLAEAYRGFATKCGIARQP